MRTARVYTKEETELISDPIRTAEEIGKILNVHPITVYRARKQLGIQVAVGAKVGKPNIKKMRQVERICKKKYCSHSCQQRTANVAKKGTGSRKIRNPLIKEYTRYARKVHHLSHKTYLQNIDKKLKYTKENEYPFYRENNRSISILE